MSDPVAATAPDVALLGRDPTPRLVDVCPLVHPGQEGPARVRLYARTATGAEVTAEEATFFPFFFLSDVALLKGFPRARFQFQPLAGTHFYRYLVVFTSWRAYWDALRHVERSAERTEGSPEACYVIPNPAQQYLMQTGRTCFKGLAFDDLHRLQLDIEAWHEGGFPLAERAEDAVIIVSLSDNRGWKRLLHQRELSEQALLATLVEAIRARNPDVIEGHNIFGFDLPYLMTRCQRHGVPFAIGRDGSVPRTFPSSIRFAERTVDFTAVEVAGRHVVDTYFQVMAYDVFKRNLPGYGLKAVARHFGFAPEGRVYVDGNDIGRVWREDPDRLLAYALDDVVETERLARHLSGSSFYLTQMLPMTYGQVVRTGPAAKIESLFVREYLRRRHSLPASQWGSQQRGGYTDVFFTGVTGPIVYADVESLYPSIMLHYDVRPRSDTLRLFPQLLRRLTDLRFAAKHAMKTAVSEEQRSELDARQNSYKNLINSFYGNLGFSLALFNDFAEADRVATIGQQLLKQTIGHIRTDGGQVIEVDTDGVLFVPPPGVTGDEAERAYVHTLTDRMPEGIRIGFDGRFARMLSYKKKNYALLGYDGKLRFKGSSLVSRATERFGREFIREAVRLLMEEDPQGLHDLYLATRDRILHHSWKGVDDFARTETLKDTPETYRSEVQAGKRTKAAAYELALRRAAATGQGVRKGDRITFYITGTQNQVTSFEAARLAEEWQSEQPDENVAYYLKRLDEFAARFEPFFTPHDFRLLFSPPDLFGFSASGIRLRNELHEGGLEGETEEIPF
jgi:DNA polymerase elongation subunit (family B)